MGRLSHRPARPQRSRGRTTDEELWSLVALVTKTPTYVENTGTRVPAGALRPRSRAGATQALGMGGREGKPSPESSIFLSLPNIQ